VADTCRAVIGNTSIATTPDDLVMVSSGDGSTCIKRRKRNKLELL